MAQPILTEIMLRPSLVYIVPMLHHEVVMHVLVDALRHYNVFYQ